MTTLKYINRYMQSLPEMAELRIWMDHGSPQPIVTARLIDWRGETILDTDPVQRDRIMRGSHSVGEALIKLEEMMKEKDYHEIVQDKKSLAAKTNW